MLAVESNNMAYQPPSGLITERKRTTIVWRSFRRTAN